MTGVGDGGVVEVAAHDDGILPVGLDILLHHLHLMGSYAHADQQLVLEEERLGPHRVFLHVALQHFLIAVALFGRQMRRLQMVVDDDHRVLANLQVVVAFRMLPEVVWAMPEYGTFNVHAALLPQYRGAAPINWAVINGETETGVTTFFLDHDIDTGRIILQKPFAIPDEAGMFMTD